MFSGWVEREGGGEGGEREGGREEREGEREGGGGRKGRFKPRKPIFFKMNILGQRLYVCVVQMNALQLQSSKHSLNVHKATSSVSTCVQYPHEGYILGSLCH